MVRQLVKEMENSEFKPVKLHLKINLGSYLAQAEGLVNRIIIILIIIIRIIIRRRRRRRVRRRISCHLSR